MKREEISHRASGGNTVEAPDSQGTEQRYQWHEVDCLFSWGSSRLNSWEKLPHSQGRRQKENHQLWLSVLRYADPKLKYALAPITHIVK